MGIPLDVLYECLDEVWHSRGFIESAVLLVCKPRDVAKVREESILVKCFSKITKNICRIIFAK